MAISETGPDARFDFHRQRPVDRYIVDFICSELWLVIELDGYTHQLDERTEKDILREERLKELGLRVIRFWDEEVIHDIDSVLAAIEYVVLEQKDKLGQYHPLLRGDMVMKVAEGHLSYQGVCSVKPNR